MILIKRLNNYLRVFKPFSKSHKVLIGDDSRSPIEPVKEINDENTGSAANILMYLSKIKGFLIKQININTATDDHLAGLKRFYGIKKWIGESDESYRVRLKKVLIHIKESPVAIEEIIKEFADYVEVLDGSTDGMFDNVSFDSFYGTGYTMPNPEGPGEWEITEARDRGGITGQPYYFRVMLTNPDLNNLKTIAYLIDVSHVSGTYYDIFIVS